LADAVDACVNKSSPFLKTLLESRSKSWRRALQESSAMRVAIHANEIETLRLLSDHGAHPDDPRYEGLTLLAWAIASKKSVEAIDALLALGADASLCSWGAPSNSPLYRAASRGNTYLIRALISAGAKIAAGSSRDFLVCASQHDDPTSLSLLAAIAPKIDERSSANGETPLLTCAGEGRHKAVKALLAAGADWTLETKDGTNALGEALAHGCQETVLAILESGANPGKIRIDGEERSILQWAKKLDLTQVEGWIRAHRQRDELAKASKPIPPKAAKAASAKSASAKPHRL
jgi:ankyrin repeat protein